MGNMMMMMNDDDNDDDDDSDDDGDSDGETMPMICMPSLQPLPVLVACNPTSPVSNQIHYNIERNVFLFAQHVEQQEDHSRPGRPKQTKHSPEILRKQHAFSSAGAR
jgi:hypothetical protein